jgi:queuosine precursor transporter
VNELLLLLISAICVVFVLAMWKLGKERLYSAIIVFLILISAIGGKIVPFFGHYTNTGNVFYASVFLATYFLIERFGKKEGIRSIWVGVICVTTFSTLISITVALSGSPTTTLLDAAYTIAFSTVPRTTLASLIAYICAQNVNVYLYTYLKEKMMGKRLWLRANISNVAGQFVDSLIFFTIAFWGVVPMGSIWGILLTGFFIKVLFVAIASPLLYMNRIQEETVGEYSWVTKI